MIPKCVILLPTQLAFNQLPSLTDWALLATDLGNKQRYLPWWLGDMLVAGEQQMGDEIYQAFSDELSIDMLQRYAKVCREFDPKRRNAALSFSSHQLLCGLEQPIQDAMLARGERERWRTDDMRRAVRELKQTL